MKLDEDLEKYGRTYEVQVDGRVFMNIWSRQARRDL